MEENIDMPVRQAGKFINNNHVNTVAGGETYFVLEVYV